MKTIIISSGNTKAREFFSQMDQIKKEVIDEIMAYEKYKTMNDKINIPSIPQIESTCKKIENDPPFKHCTSEELEEMLSRISDKKLQEIFDKVSAMEFEGPTINEYFKAVGFNPDDK